MLSVVLNGRTGSPTASHAAAMASRPEIEAQETGTCVNLLLLHVELPFPLS